MAGVVPLVFRSPPRVLVLVLPLALAPAATGARAQTHDSTYASRASERLIARLQADATLPDSVRRRSVSEMFSRFDPSVVGRLDDAATSLVFRTFSATIRQLPDSSCTSYFGGDTPTSPVVMARVLAGLDSALVDQWMTVLEAMVRSEGQRRTGRVAEASEGAAVMIGIMGRLGTAERQRLIEGLDGDDPREECWAMRLVLAGLAELPPAELGPIVRAMFPAPSAGGGKPARRPKGS